MPDDPDFKGMTPDNTFIEVTLHFMNDEYTMVIIGADYCFVESKDLFIREAFGGKIERVFLRKRVYDQFIDT